MPRLSDCDVTRKRRVPRAGTRPAPDHDHDHNDLVPAPDPHRPLRLCSDLHTHVGPSLTAREQGPHGRLQGPDRKAHCEDRQRAFTPAVS